MNQMEDTPMMKKNFMNDDEYDSCDAHRQSWCEIPDYLDIKFYRCKICGQIMATIGKQANPLSCCGEEMSILEPASVEASAEHHIPVYKKSGHKIKVQVGEIKHPMTPDHHIEWICMVTCCGVQWMPLSYDGEPEAEFRLKSDEKVLAIYSYCNIHGLWRGEEADD